MADSITAGAPRPRQIHLPPTAALHLRGDGLLLRPWEMRDAAAFARGVSDPEFLRWNSPRSRVMSQADAVAWIEHRAETYARAESAYFCVEDAADGTVLGHVGFGAIDPHMRAAVVGYWVLPEARGRGVARRALARCARWGFEVVGLHRIALDHAVGHEASCRVAEHCGFRYEGTLRDALSDEDDIWGFRDAHLHARLATDPGQPDAAAVPGGA
jgi:RimJ/RimL family protein N-acetyltransferase